MRSATWQRNQKLIEEFKGELKINPHLTLTSYCKTKGYNYGSVREWAKRNKVYVSDIKSELSGSKSVFAPLTTISRPIKSSHSSLRGIDIKFTDGVSLHLEECGVEEVVSLLILYRSRQAARDGVCSL